jgi:hypothetical protein
VAAREGSLHVIFTTIGFEANLIDIQGKYVDALAYLERVSRGKGAAVPS